MVEAGLAPTRLSPRAVVREQRSRPRCSAGGGAGRHRQGAWHDGAPAALQPSLPPVPPQVSRHATRSSHGAESASPPSRHPARLSAIGHRPPLRPRRDHPRRCARAGSPGPCRAAHRDRGHRTDRGTPPRRPGPGSHHRPRRPDRGEGRHPMCRGQDDGSPAFCRAGPCRPPQARLAAGGATPRLDSRALCRQRAARGLPPDPALIPPSSWRKIPRGCGGSAPARRRGRVLPPLLAPPGCAPPRRMATFARPTRETRR